MNSCSVSVGFGTSIHTTPDLISLSYFTDLRYVSEELSGPVATFIYGDKVNINIWDPSMVCILIHSKLVADMYKKHFDLLWKVAKK